MINVRSYFKGKEKNDKKATRVNYMERIRSHKFTIFYRSMLVALLVAAIVAAVIIQWKNKIYTECVVVSSVDIAVVQSRNLTPFAGCILTYSKDGASCIDTKGNAVWNETFEMQNPMIDICQNVVAIGDYNGRNIYVMDTNSRLGQITTNKPIRSFCVASNGVVAVVLDDSDLTLIYLYDTKGNELVRFRTTMKSTGYPFKVAISPNGKLVCVSYLYVDSGELKSSVAFYNFGEVGQNNTDNYVSGYDYLDVIVGYTRFWDDKSMFAVSDDRIEFFAGAEKPVSIATSMLSEDVQRIYYGKDYVGLIFNSVDSNNRYRLDVYNKSGQMIQTINFNIDYSDILFEDDRIIIYNEAECKIYNMNGVEKYSGVFEKSVYTMLPTSSSYKYILVTPDSIDTIELK
ncbi:MAG: hypothetical protein HDR03_12190 [Lachnospiraceae bacterium]|nr:hypothetical protein [Lachnospiraceae bacterium]